MFDAMCLSSLLGLKPMFSWYVFQKQYYMMSMQAKMESLNIYNYLRFVRLLEDTYTNNYNNVATLKQLQT